jgi:predicted DNA repair protein MutK
MTGGLFAILDDIAMLLDDAAMVTKASIKQTSPILADDLAVNAEKSAGFHASRELPVLWAITKGAFRNKLIILPLAFILSAIAPWIIAPILIIGGIYLAFEGAEKVHEYIQEKFFGHKHEEGSKKVLSEEDKIKSAILTDFILSIEIVVIALGTVMNEPFITQIIAVSLVAFIATVGVYGIVALIVRMDDMGFYLIKNSKDGSLKDKFGEMLVAGLPKVVKVLAVVGTIAMLLVAGGIFTHNVEAIHHIYEDSFSFLPMLLFDGILGLIVGYIAFFIIEPIIHKFKKEEE